MVPSALRRLPARPLLRRALSALTRVDPAAVLTDADVERFSKDGAIVLRGVFQPWVEHLRAGAELNLANPGPLCDEHAAAQGTSGRFHDDQFLWRRHELFKEFVLHSGAGALAARHARAAHGAGRSGRQPPEAGIDRAAGRHRRSGCDGGAGHAGQGSSLEKSGATTSSKGAGAGRDRTWRTTSARRKRSTSN